MSTYILFCCRCYLLQSIWIPDEGNKPKYLNKMISCLEYQLSVVFKLVFSVLLSPLYTGCTRNTIQLLSSTKSNVKRPPCYHYTLEQKGLKIVLKCDAFPSCLVIRVDNMMLSPFMFITLLLLPYVWHSDDC